MLDFLYQQTMHAFTGAMRLASAFSPKIKLGVQGRKGLFERLETALNDRRGNRPLAWFHAASLGEFEQGRPVMEQLRAEFPDHFILLTFFSPSGYEIRKNYAGADYVCYMPIDTRENAERFVRIVRPELACFIKYEFWNNHLVALNRNQAHIISFSTIFRPGQIFFKPYGGFYRRMLRHFDFLFVQNQESLGLMHAIGIEQCSVAGDTRFDRVKSIASSARELPEIAAFVKDDACIVAGSVWEADMQVLIPALNDSDVKVKGIIAPHEIDKTQMENWRKLLKGKTLLYSEYKSGSFALKEDFDYLIIDNIGMLSSLYRYGTIAYIGGAFGSGLHNILEAATFGMPIVFGNKKYKKFEEALDLIAAGSAKAVSDTAELKSCLHIWLKQPDLKKQLDAVSAQYVTSRTGATEKIMDEIRKLLR